MYGFFANGLLTMTPEVSCDGPMTGEVRVPRQTAPSTLKVRDEIFVNFSPYGRGRYRVKKIAAGEIVLVLILPKKKRGRGAP